MIRIQPSEGGVRVRPRSLTGNCRPVRVDRNLVFWHLNDLVPAVLRLDMVAANLHPDEVADLIADIIDNEFDTIIEDGSVGQISALLCKHYELCRQGRESEVLESLQQRLPQTRTLRVPVAGDYDSDDEAEMQVRCSFEKSLRFIVLW
ncbi:hypothetical protein HPB48_013762 [Haemaphysalis longicornis]|uniref:Pre-rRNA-processing protein TSR2 homolog n=1 Tax=Haemaphysalis longicornis TaxID=44386 RepID=A0A9J6FKL1_HAELO|nr:hypothetical protein HPB48_013762 [Haemaphysalis longicornis]